MQSAVERLKEIIAAEALAVRDIGLSRAEFGDFVLSYFRNNPWPETFVNAAYIQYLKLDKSKTMQFSGPTLVGIRVADHRREKLF